MIEHSAPAADLPDLATQRSTRARRPDRDPEILYTLNRERIAGMMDGSRPVTPQDPAGLYLQACGMTVERIKTMGRVLRYTPSITYWEGRTPTSIHPALLAEVNSQDTTTTELPRQLLRVYLTQRGTLAPVRNPIKRTGCHAPNRGGAVRLGAPILTDGAWRLGVAVGLPQALQASRCSGLPVWAVTGLEELAAMRFPRKTPLRFLHIFTNDRNDHHVKELERRALAFDMWANVCPLPTPQTVTPESTATP